MRALVILGLLLGLALVTGCATMTQTPSQVASTYGRVFEYDFREMPDDWNFIWMVDRPSRLTRWQMR